MRTLTPSGMVIELTLNEAEARALLDTLERAENRYPLPREMLDLIQVLRIYLKSA